MTYRILFLSSLIIALTVNKAYAQPNVTGADESTPSHSEYFTWINHSFEGPTEETVMAGLVFFKYLQDTYGIHLDIFTLDVGTIDRWNFYDSIDSPRVKKHFARSLAEQLPAPPSPRQ